MRASRLPGSKRKRRSLSVRLEGLESRVLLAADGDFGFAFTSQETLVGQGTAITTDSSGDVLVAGGFQGTIDLDPGPGITRLTTEEGPGSPSVFIAKYTSDGSLVWGRQLDGGGLQVRQLTTDSDGNVYATGLFFLTVDFDPGVGTESRSSVNFLNDAFILKLDRDGNFSFVKTFGGTGNDIGYGIAVDGQQNVYTTGVFSGTVDFDTGPEVQNVTSQGNFDIFVSKLNSSGDFVFAKTIGTALDDNAYGIALDSQGDVYTTGVFSGTLDFDPGPGIQNRTSQGSTDAFVWHLDHDGGFGFAETVGGPDGDAALALALDSSDNVFYTGYYSGTVDFDPGAGISNRTSEGASGSFLSKLDSNGHLIYAQTLGGGTVNFPLLAVSDNGEAYFANFYRETVDFDPGAGIEERTSNGGSDIVLSKFDAEGNFVYASSVGGPNDDLAYCVAIDEEGNLYSTGYFTDTGDFDPGPATYDLIGAGDTYNFFLIKLQGSGGSDPAPTLVISSDEAVTSAAAITFTFQFSQPMMGFTVSDISLTNASAGAFTEIDADTYTLVVAPLADGMVTVSVEAGKATDAEGHPNLAATGSVLYDGTGPVFSSSANFEVAENTSAVGSVAATDIHGPVTFGLEAGGDSALFSIETTTGVLTFSAPPDLEVPADVDHDNIYSLQVRATDSLGVSTVQSVLVTVTAVNDNAPIFTSGAAFEVASNTTVAGTVTAIDADVPLQIVIYSISGGADGLLFTISNVGVLSFLSPPDVDAPADDDGDNVYEVEVTAADEHGLTQTQALTVTVTNAAAAPQLTNVSAVTWTKVRPPTTINVLPTVAVTATGELTGGTLLIAMDAVGSKRKSADFLQALGVSTIGTGGNFIYADRKLTLQIDLGEQATVAKVQSFLQGITFITRGKGPKTPTRTLQVTLTDANHLSSSVNQTIFVRKKP